MDFSRLNPGRTLMGAVSSLLLLVSVLFLPWYTLSVADNAARVPGRNFQPDAFICGVGDLHCTGFETFPIVRWLLILAAIAPLILGWIIVRSNRLSYPPGEMTMTAGLAAMVLILYNGRRRQAREGHRRGRRLPRLRLRLALIGATELRSRASCAPRRTSARSQGPGNV